MLATKEWIYNFYKKAMSELLYRCLNPTVTKEFANSM